MAGASTHRLRTSSICVTKYVIERDSPLGSKATYGDCSSISSRAIVSYFGSKNRYTSVTAIPASSTAAGAAHFHHRRRACRMNWAFIPCPWLLLGCGALLRVDHLRLHCRQGRQLSRGGRITRNRAMKGDVVLSHDVNL